MSHKKVLLLENHHEIDIPKSLISIINSEWGEKFDIEKWTSFHDAYWPENRKATMKRLFSADAFIARHVFVDWCQLEIFIEVLTAFMNKGKSVDFYLMHPDLLEMFNKWFDESEAYTTPNTDEYNEDPDLRETFKKEMNKQFLKVLDYHNIFQISKYLSDFNSEMTPIKSTDIKH